jgi:hypothetical protein
MKLKVAFYSKFGFAALLASSAYGVFATPTFSTFQDTKSAMKDTSNLYGSSSKYDIQFSQDVSDPTLYINQIAISYGGTWDPNLDINLNAPTGYTLGSAITGAQSFNFNELVKRNGSVDNAVATGIYDFTIDFIGGIDNLATDALGSVYCQLEVFDRLEYDILSGSTPSSIQRNQSSTVSVELQNLMPTRDLVTSTWYYGGNGLSMGSNFLFGSFVGNWFGLTVPALTSLNGTHTNWTASPVQPYGVYTSNLGIVGGLYQGDEHYMIAQPTTIEVVTPEPATLVTLGIGAVAILRRRRKS